MARRRISRRKSVALVAVLLGALAWFVRDLRRDSRPPAPGPAPQWRTIVRVVDGDTLLLDGHERVRLIGVNTPESVDPRRPVERFGKEAAAFTRRLAEGRRARLEFDQERYDRHGRTLAYVYLEDGTFVNAEIIRRGYGYAFTRYPYRFATDFRAFEREAREQRRGLWAGGS